MALAKTIELVASSPTSWADAVESAVKSVSATIRHITGVDVVHQTATVKDGHIDEYRVTVHVAFLVEEHTRFVETV